MPTGDLFCLYSVLRCLFIHDGQIVWLKDALICYYFIFFNYCQAYASYMKGTLLFEQDKNWQTALVNFKNARYT
jgi:hypothetical protein